MKTKTHYLLAGNRDGGLRQNGKQADTLLAGEEGMARKQVDEWSRDKDQT